MLKKIWLIGFFVLGGCVTQLPDPVVAAYNGDSVALQVNGINIYTPDSQIEEIRQKRDEIAGEICRLGHRKRAEFASVRYVPTGQYGGYHEFLYLCLN